MKLVEVRIDLSNCNEKIIMEYFDIVKETDKHYLANVDEWNRSQRRFLKGTLKCVLHGGKLNYYYRFITNSDDIRHIEKSEQMNGAVFALYARMKKDVNYYTRTLDNRFDYYKRNYMNREGVEHDG